MDIIKIKIFMFIQKKTHNTTQYRQDMFNIKYRVIKNEIKFDV